MSVECLAAIFYSSQRLSSPEQQPRTEEGRMFPVKRTPFQLPLESLFFVTPLSQSLCYPAGQDGPSIIARMTSPRSTFSYETLTLRMVTLTPFRLFGTGVNWSLPISISSKRVSCSAKSNLAYKAARVRYISAQARLEPSVSVSAGQRTSDKKMVKLLTACRDSFSCLSRMVENTVLAASFHRDPATAQAWKPLGCRIHPRVWAARRSSC